jgi:SAM-dependent methyltransferase
MELEIFPPDERALPPLPQPLAQGPYPVIPLDPDDWSLNYGNRLTPALTSYAPVAAPGDVLLDVGCGDGRLGRWLADARGFDYLGMDYDHAGAPMLADAELLPVADTSVPVVVSFAVLEHVRSPARMVAEIARCLRPGGVFIGTVAFLEPFHMVSHFHHTHVGVQVVLRDAGLGIVGVESNDAWFGHQAILEMAGRGRAAGYAVRARRKLVRNVPQLHRAVKADPERLASVTAGFRFVARKPLAE